MNWLPPLRLVVSDHFGVILGLRTSFHVTHLSSCPFPCDRSVATTEAPALCQVQGSARNTRPNPGLGDLPGRLPPSKNRKWERRPLLILQGVCWGTRCWGFDGFLPKGETFSKVFLQLPGFPSEKIWKSNPCLASSLVPDRLHGVSDWICEMCWMVLSWCVQSYNGQRIPLLTWGVVKASFPQGPEGTFWPCFLETHRMIWVFFSWSIKKCWFNHTIDPKHVGHYRQLRAWALQRSPRSFGKPWTKMTAVRMLSWCCVWVKADIMTLQSSLISVQFADEVFVHLHHEIYEFILRKPVGGGNNISPAQSHPEVKRRSTSWTLEMQRFSRSSRWPLK